MNHIILLALLSSALFLLLWIRHYRLKCNYGKHLELSASLLLGKERSRRSRVHGSIIFHLEHYPESLQGLRITAVRGIDDSVLVKEFGRLYFDLNDKSRTHVKLCSVGVVLNGRALQQFSVNRGHVYIRGIMRFSGREDKKFAAKLPVLMQDRS